MDFQPCFSKMADSPHAHMAVVDSNGAAAAYMALVQQSNEAVALVKAHKLAEAEALLRDVLARKPSAGFDAVSIAVTQNALGEALRQRGQLDEALELLKLALEVRERDDAQKGVTFALRDGNITRDELAKVFEAKGDCPSALATREPGKRICSSETCNAMDYKELLACARCKCVFYCGKECQRQDWKARHKPLCQPIDRSAAP